MERETLPAPPPARLAVNGGPTTVVTLEKPTWVAIAKERLIEVDRQLASMAALRAERDMLVRVVALAEGKNAPLKAPRWTPEEDSRLLELRAGGKEIAAIARELGVSKSRVQWRLRTLRLRATA